MLFMLVHRLYITEWPFPAFIYVYWVTTRNSTVLRLEIQRYQKQIFCLKCDEKVKNGETIFSLYTWMKASRRVHLSQGIRSSHELPRWRRHLQVCGEKYKIGARLTYSGMGGNLTVLKNRTLGGLSRE